MGHVSLLLMWGEREHSDHHSEYVQRSTRSQNLSLKNVFSLILVLLVGSDQRKECFFELCLLSQIFPSLALILHGFSDY